MLINFTLYIDSFIDMFWSTP